jgi:hypothetical protein
MLTIILAVLSASAAAGMRLALPLLVLSLFYYEDSGFKIPLLEYFDPRIVLAILISWSLFELFGSKKLLGQRVLQIVQLLFSPIAGAIIAISITTIAGLEEIPIWLIGLIGGLFALVLTLVQAGWFFRLRGIPLWVVLIDILCFFLVFFAFTSPLEGGLIALLLLWLALRSSRAWRDWYLARKQASLESN